MTTFSRLLRQKIKENPDYEVPYVKKWDEIELPEVKGIRRVLVLQKNAENLQNIRRGRK